MTDSTETKNDNEGLGEKIVTALGSDISKPSKRAWFAKADPISAHPISYTLFAFIAVLAVFALGFFAGLYTGSVV